ncbi:barley mlo defense gene homolog6 [Zea mays]|uniref:Barley mlo defense gene homolog6 n=1 Tax=Zea mays TaxID=4577 RepID=A0A1D6GWX8_MAIZE|nr:barley mlo defense gene homolog6 [Zea mays]AQK67368.1 barley mlo defense gene homolog6 [Zea mays]
MGGGVGVRRDRAHLHPAGEGAPPRGRVLLPPQEEGHGGGPGEGEGGAHGAGLHLAPPRVRPELHHQGLHQQPRRQHHAPLQARGRRRRGQGRPRQGGRRRGRWQEEGRRRRPWKEEEEGRRRRRPSWRCGGLAAALLRAQRQDAGGGEHGDQVPRGESAAHLHQRPAPAAHLHLLPRRLPRLLQRNHHGARQGQGDRF